MFRGGSWQLLNSRASCGPGAPSSFSPISLQPPSGSRQPPNFISGEVPLLAIVDVDTASGSNLVTPRARHIMHISPSFGTTSPSSSLIPLTDLGGTVWRSCSSFTSVPIGPLSRLFAEPPFFPQFGDFRCLRVRDTRSRKCRVLAVEGFSPPTVPATYHIDPLTARLGCDLLITASHPLNCIGFHVAQPVVVVDSRPYHRPFLLSKSELIKILFTPLYQRHHNVPTILCATSNTYTEIYPGPAI